VSKTSGQFYPVIPWVIGRVKFLISPTYSYGAATAIRAWVTHLALMEHGVLMVKL